MDSIYLDNAATTQVRDEVVDTMVSVLNSNYGNASSTHGFGRSSKSNLYSMLEDRVGRRGALRVPEGGLQGAGGGVRVSADVWVLFRC